MSKSSAGNIEVKEGIGGTTPCQRNTVCGVNVTCGRPNNMKCNSGSGNMVTGLDTIPEANTNNLGSIHGASGPKHGRLLTVSSAQTRKTTGYNLTTPSAATLSGRRLSHNRITAM